MIVDNSEVVNVTEKIDGIIKSYYSNHAMPRYDKATNTLIIEAKDKKDLKKYLITAIEVLDL